MMDGTNLSTRPDAATHRSGGYEHPGKHFLAANGFDIESWSALEFASGNSLKFLIRDDPDFIAQGGVTAQNRLRTLYNNLMGI